MKIQNGGGTSFFLRITEHFELLDFKLVSLHCISILDRSDGILKGIAFSLTIVALLAEGPLANKSSSNCKLN